jgi:Domain of unknown function (DUF1707)
MRISDEDRRVAGERLGAAVNEGRLTPTDYDDRLGRLYQAVTYADLESLFVDLPQPYWAGGGYGQAGYGQAAPTAYPMPYAQGYPATYVARNSGPATAGLVLGILGLVGFWIPFGGFVLSGLGVIFSGVGLSQTRGNAMSGRGQAIGGLICSVLGLIPAALVVLFLLLGVAFIF